MTYHIIIQQERRAPRQTEFGEDRSRLAIGISTAVPTGNTVETSFGGTAPEYMPGPEQLHTHSHAALPESLADPQFVGVFEWDGRAPYVIAHKGDYSAVTMRYAGWPEITKEEFDALPRPDPL